MEKKFKLLGLIVLVVIAGLSMTACKNGTEEEIEELEPVIYTATRSGVEYVLTIFPSPARAAYFVGDSYIFKEKRGQNERISTGKVMAITEATMVLQPSTEGAPAMTVQQMAMEAVAS